MSTVYFQENWPQDISHKKKPRQIPQTMTSNSFTARLWEHVGTILKGSLARLRAKLSIFSRPQIRKLRGPNLGLSKSKKMLGLQKLTWWTFRIFFIFAARGGGEGESEAPGRVGGGGRIFIENPKRGGGSPRRGKEGAEGPGGCLRGIWVGGGPTYFFSGPNFPPS